MADCHSRLLSRGSLAAFVQAVVSLATLSIVIGFIGPQVLADRHRFIALALSNPAPLLLLDALKLVSVATSLAFVRVFVAYLKPHRPALVRTGSFFGLAAVTCLLANATLSTYAVTHQASLPAAQAEELNRMIGLLALGTLMANGLWYLCIHWVTRQLGNLPRGLSYLGLGIGVVSLVPPLALVVLCLTVGWSLWLGNVFRQSSPNE